MDQLGPCSLAAIVRQLEASRRCWVVWSDVAGMLDDLVDVDELVVRDLDGPHGRYRAYALPCAL